MRILNGLSATAIALSQIAATPLMAQDTRNLPPPGYPGGSQEFAGTLRCASYDKQRQDCPVQTSKRVALLERVSGKCRENKDWGYDDRRIWVDNRCVATFGYGYANVNRPQPGGTWNDRNYAGTLQCTARGRQQERCYIATENRVELLDQSRDRCVAGRTWGYTADFIWVSEKCAATFGYGNSYRPQPQEQSNKGPSTGAIIGGVIVAGGLLALLTRGKSKKPTSSTPAATSYPAKPPAAISADLSSVRAEARPAVQTCLFEASRQIGVTGGSKIRFDRVTSLVEANGGYRANIALTSTYPDGNRATPIFCRATSSQAIELTFTE